MGRTVVIVESPSKAKTINRYLGNDYAVVASIGHIRDLLSKNGSVDPKNDFSMVWELSSRAKDVVKNIEQVLKDDCTDLLLATDPDREGEAISWHVSEVLRQKKLLNHINVQRIVFHEITKKAVIEAIKAPRPINKELVDAYLARRALDYLVGFTLSPILWRKLPGAKSAGRVQSVALRLVVDREQEIERFISQEYWTILACLKKDTTHQHSLPPTSSFNAKLVQIDGKKLEKFDIPNEKIAKSLQKKLEQCQFFVEEVKKKKTQRHPAPPFITSTLQQEASRKLGFSTSKTMTLAQRLYEGTSIDGEVTGLITYMRTDGTNIAQDAIDGIRSYIKENFSKSYLPNQEKIYKTKVKNAQEAHEAIRPTSVLRTPNDVAPYIDGDQLALYTLIWKRTLACQMQSAQFDQVIVDIISDQYNFVLRSVGTTMTFDGFLCLYQEGQDDISKDEDDTNTLPVLEKGEQLLAQSLSPEQHFTQPPPRFSEASLVKKMEELGIGRPSTYVPVLQLLQDRGYVKLEKRYFVPHVRGRLVTSFLNHYFSQYVKYDFTARIEEQLDEISNGSLDWRQVLHEFWNPFITNVDSTKDLKITDVVNFLQEDLNCFLFGDDLQKDHPCPSCTDGKLHLKLGKYGAFLGCSMYPTCSYIQNIEQNDGNGVSAESPMVESITIGNDPTTGQQILLKNGRFGYYLEWEPIEVCSKEENIIDQKETDDLNVVSHEIKKKSSKTTSITKETKKKVKKTKAKTNIKKKTVGIPNGISIQDVDLPLALRLGSLPFEIGTHPNDAQPLSIGSGRFGPYIKHGTSFISIPKGYDFLNLTLEEALEIMEKKKERMEKRSVKKKYTH